MKGRLLLTIGIAVLVLSSGCTCGGLDIEGLVKGVSEGGIEAVIGEALTPGEMEQNCKDRGGEICTYAKVCRGEKILSRELGNCCIGGCDERTEEEKAVVEQNCRAQGGYTCKEDEICRGGQTGSVDIGECCNKECEKLTEYDECGSKADCDDGNLSTTDICIGRPSMCVHGEMKCEGFVCFGAAAIMPDRCINVSCPSNQKCYGGHCVSDLCLGVDCRENKTCVEGRCISNLCLNVDCPDGKRCVNGECVEIYRPSESERCVGEECVEIRRASEDCEGEECEQVKAVSRYRLPEGCVPREDGTLGEECTPILIEE